MIDILFYEVILVITVGVLFLAAKIIITIFKKAIKFYNDRKMKLTQ